MASKSPTKEGLEGLGFVGSKLREEDICEEGFFKAKERAKKERKKVIKSRVSDNTLVAKKEIQVEQIGLLLGKTLMGKFLGRKMRNDSLNQWI